ncbi:MAG TPA: UGSC family (seleno)protein [Methanobacterium sp.]|nr:UGSC family (seleno)protein [Methanobacterium sp.]
MKVKIMEREVLNPLGEIDALDVKLNPIPGKIEILSLFDNSKPGADVILEKISRNITFNKTVNVRKPAGAPTADEQMKQALKSDLSILALGDCGSCTTWLILDAIKLEKHGIPTISICSDIFVSYARVLARSYGADGLRIVDVEHPIAGLAREKLEDKTIQTIIQIKNLL